MFLRRSPRECVLPSSTDQHLPIPRALRLSVGAACLLSLLAGCGSDDGATARTCPVKETPAAPVTPAPKAGECKGIQRFCSTYAGISSCNGQYGCSWNSSGQYCEGYARDCERISESSCFMQDGCSWKESVDAGAEGEPVEPSSECADGG